MARNRKGRKYSPTAPTPAGPDVDLTTSAPATPSSTASSSSAISRQNRRQKAITQSEIKRQKQYILIGVMVIAGLAFFNSLSGEFVYDDKFQILKNSSLGDVSNIFKMFSQSVWQFMNASSADAVGLYYRPLFNVLLIINYQLFGQSPVGWHLVSLLLHLITTFLVYKLASEWQMPFEVSAGAALLFGLHPVHVESVAWISGVPDPLASVFLLASVICYEKYYRGRNWQSGKRAFLTISLVAAALSMFSKETAIVLPMFLGLRELLDAEHEESYFAAFKRAVIRAVPYLAIAIFYMLVRYKVLGFFSKDEPKAIGVTPVEVLLTLPIILLRYVRMLLFPTPLAIVYDQTFVSETGDMRFWGAAAAVALILALVIWFVRASAVGQRALVWMLLFLLPVLNLKVFNPQESLLHDRYLYIPSVGFCILLALGIYRAAEALGEKQKRVYQVAMGVIAVFFLVLTIGQNQTWKDDLAMTSNALKHAPEWSFLNNYLGAYYFQQSNIAESERYYSEAIRNNPNNYDAYVNLGELYRNQGRNSEAEQYFLQGIDKGAIYADSFYNLAVMYTSMGRLPDAEKQLVRAVELNPKSSNALYNLAWVYDQQGRVAEAEQYYSQTLQVNPTYPEPRINLAIIQTKKKQYQEALNNLTYAQTLAPDHPIMLFALADVYLQTNKYQNAIDLFTRLIRREPQHRFAYTKLGLAYEGIGNKEQARANFQKALEVAPQDPFTETARQHLANL